MSFIIQGFDVPKDETIQIQYANKYGEIEAVFVDESNIVHLPKDHGRLADLDDLSARMYHEAFIADTPMQKWDGGCWIRYKMFENCRDSTPIIFKAEV